jgi:regulatory protein
MPPEKRATARTKALELLARREHSRKELRVKLRGRGFDSDEVNTVVEGLADQGLQSDDRFLELFVEARVARGQGPLKIAAELRARGVNGSIVTAALDSKGQRWIDLARTLRERRFGSGLPTEIKERATQIRFLAQRGFTSEQTRAAFVVSENHLVVEE